MSEQSMDAEAMQSPKDRAIAYIQYRDATRFGKDKKIVGKGQKIGSALPIPRGEWRGMEVDLVKNYESVIDRLDDNAARRAMEGLRPFAYDTARVLRWGAGLGELVVGWKFLFTEKFIENSKLPNKLKSSGVGKFLDTGFGGIVGAGATAIFRPVELAGSAAGHVLGFVGREVYAPIANAILGGGKPKEMPKAA